jgi:DNA-binding transcriptional LysR family regulator
MSRALERLREMFDDVLLVRSGGGYERTRRAESVLRELESLLPRLEAMVRGEQFDPASQSGTISCGTDRPGIYRLDALSPGARKGRCGLGKGGGIRLARWRL